MFAWLVDGATATSPIADMDIYAIHWLNDRAARFRGVSKWVDIQIGDDEELVGATLESPAWPEPVREVWNLLAMELAAERDRRSHVEADFAAVIDEGMGVHAVGDATIEPDDAG